MTAALRCLCLVLVALGGGFAGPARAGTGPAGSESPCGAAVDASVVTVAAEDAAEPCCCCGGACHCTPATPQRGCDCSKKAPRPQPQPAEPVLPKPPPVNGSVAVARRAIAVPPDTLVVARLRAATASGLPHVLLPGRSRQVALSVWRC